MSVPVAAPAPRSVSAIAREIRKVWRPVYYAAVPYLDAMLELESVNDAVMHDSGRSIVTYFLGNASTWRGPDAKRIKAELKALLATKK